MNGVAWSTRQLNRSASAVGTHSISTTLTSHPGIVRNWLNRILHHHRRHRHRLIIGLGVQWTPIFLSLLPKPCCNTPLCVGNRCLIFQLRHSPTSPLILRRILADPTITFVGLHNHSDATKLFLSHHRLEMVDGMPVDLRRHVYGYDGRRLVMASIEKIAYEVVGVVIDRSEKVGLSDWEVEELGFAQVQQATLDAFVAFTVGIKINAFQFNIHLQDMMDISD